MLQGERQFSRDNKSLGKFQLADIPPAARGVPQIEVTFDIDANGILNVSAKDLGTGKSQNIVITASSGLSKDEVEKMRRDAESHAEEDKARREEVELRNEADNAVYRSEKFVKDNADKLGAAKSGIELAVASVKDSLKGSDSAAIRSSLDQLNAALQSASAGMYQKEPGAGTEQASSDAGAGGSEAGSKGGQSKSGDQGPIIDAEVVDEKKKA